MRSFRSQNLGVQRLAVVLAVIAAARVAWTQAKPFRALQQRGWDHAYYQQEIAKHPELTLTQNAFGWYLQDDQIEKRAKDDCARAEENFEKRWKAARHAPGQTPEMFAPYCSWDWRTSVVERFHRTADVAPTFLDYLSLALVPISAAAIAWITIHTIALRCYISPLQLPRTDGAIISSKDFG